VSAKDRVDVIVTNPPFGGMEEDGIENNSEPVNESETNRTRYS
jgi:type I restriction-modification system DNA methylase subunit